MKKAVIALSLCAALLLLSGCGASNRRSSAPPDEGASRSSQADTGSTADASEVFVLSSTAAQEDLARYYGRKVNYTPVSPNPDLTDENANTFRLFYVDLDGKYGTPGDIYLRADGGNKSLSLLEGTGLERPDSSEIINLYDEKSFSTVKILNPDFTDENWDKLGPERRGILSWMCDSAVWDGYRDESLAGQIKFIVGGPSLELFCDSYSAKYPESALSAVRATDSYGDSCYGYTFNGTLQEDLYYNTDLEDKRTEEMYLPKKRGGCYMITPANGSGKAIWYTYQYTAKPNYCAYDAQSYLSGFCPVVCLKADTPISFAD